MSSVTDKQQLLERLRESEQAFLAAINVSEEAAAVSPSEGRWSILQITEHMALAESGVVKRLQGAPANDNPADINPPDIAADHAADQLILTIAVDRSSPRNAPERLYPAGRFQSLSEARTELQRRRRENVAFIASNSEDLRKKWIKHPLREMDGHQLVLLLCQHMHRHISQIDEIKKSAAFRAVSNQKAAS